MRDSKACGSSSRGTVRVAILSGWRGERSVAMRCQIASRRARGVAAELAASLGYENLYNMEGGMTAWRSHGYPVEK